MSFEHSFTHIDLCTMH